MQYWTSETDQAVVKFNFASSQEERDAIYSSSLHHPCSKIVENVLNTFRNVDYCGRDHETLKQEALGFLVKQMPYFSPEKGKGFTFATIVTKRYFIKQNESAYNESLLHVLLEEDNDEENGSGAILSTEQPNIDWQEFYRGFFGWWEQYLPSVIGRHQHVAKGIIDEFKNGDRDKKKPLYGDVKRQLEVDGPLICRVVVMMKPYVQGLLQSYTNDGTFQVFGLTYTGSVFHNSEPLPHISHSSYARSSPEQIQELKQLYATGKYSMKRLSRELRMPYSTVHRHLTGNTWVKKGHARGENNKNSKLTAEQVQSIRKEYQETPISPNGLAKKYGVSHPTIKRILKGTAWRHLDHSPLIGTKPQKHAKKLTAEKARELFSKYWAGSDSSNLLAEYGIARTTVENIARGKIWKSATADLRRDSQLKLIK
jgi:DNA-binding MarR family transcriptional regulator